MSTQHFRTARQVLPWRTKLLISTLSIVLFVVAGEIILRWVDFDLYYKNQFFPVNRDIDFPSVYLRDPKLFWRFRKDITTESKLFSYLNYRINSDGMRGAEIQKPKQGYRIIALGNSCTFGWGVPDEETWVYRLQEELQKEFSPEKIEVINAGVPGYSSYQGKIYFEEELVQYQPDMVLIMFGWNDHWKAGHGISDAEQRVPSKLILWFQNFFSRLKLYQLLRKVILRSTEEELLVALDDVSGKRRVSQDEFFRNLKEIVRTARARHIQPVLISPPIAPALKDSRVFRNNLFLLHRQYQQQIARVAELEQVPFIDLQAVFEQFANLFDAPREDPIHFNIAGHKVAAMAIAEEVAPLIAAQLHR